MSIAEAVAVYLEQRKIDVRTKDIVGGRWNTIRTHRNHFIECVGEKEKAANLGINTLAKFEWKGNYVGGMLTSTKKKTTKKSKGVSKAKPFPSAKLQQKKTTFYAHRHTLF